MPYAQRVILYAPPWDAPELEQFVEDCLRDGTFLVCVYGPDASRVEDVIDEIVVADGTDPERFLQTTAHEGESLKTVRQFAKAWTVNVDPSRPVQEVRLNVRRAD